MKRNSNHERALGKFLLAAAEANILQAVELTVKAGGDVNYAGNDGVTALHIAIGEGHLEFVKLLLKAGARVNVESRRGTTPLSNAQNSGNQEMIDLLQKYISKSG